MDPRIVLSFIAIASLAGCFGDDAEPEPDAMDEEPMVMIEESTMTFSDSGTIVLGTQGVESCGAVGQGDTATHTWEIPSEHEGVEVRGKDFTITMTMGSSGVDLDLFVYDADGRELGSGTTFNVADGTTTEVVSLPSAGPGAYTIEVQGCVAIAASYTLDGTVELVPR